jgi:hypothetical protein
VTHKEKMLKKEQARKAAYECQKHDNMYVPANLSQHHPDSGMSIAEHEEEKTKRQNNS